MYIGVVGKHELVALPASALQVPSCCWHNPCKVCSKAPTREWGVFVLYQDLPYKVETDSLLAEVVSVSQCYHPYSSNVPAHQYTIDKTKSQFFQGGPARKCEPWQGSYQTPPSYTSHHQSRGSSSMGRKKTFSQNDQRNFRSATSTIGPITFARLDIKLVELYVCTPVGGRPTQFVYDWSFLTSDPWVLATVQVINYLWSNDLNAAYLHIWSWTRSDLKP